MRFRRHRKSKVALPCFLVERNPLAFAFGVAIKLVIKIWSNVLAALRQARELECPEIEARVEIFTEGSCNR